MHDPTIDAPNKSTIITQSCGKKSKLSFCFFKSVLQSYVKEINQEMMLAPKANG